MTLIYLNTNIFLFSLRRLRQSYITNQELFLSFASVCTFSIAGHRDLPVKVNSLRCFVSTSKALWFRATVCCACISLLGSNSCDFVLVSTSSTEVFCGCAYSKTTCTTSKKLKTDARLTCTTTSCHGSCRDSSANQLKMRESVLFIGTQFSILYTFMYSPQWKVLVLPAESQKRIRQKCA